MIYQLEQRLFELCAPSLDYCNISELCFVESYWRSESLNEIGILVANMQKKEFDIIAFRRQRDYRFIVTSKICGIASKNQAVLILEDAMRVGDALEPIPPGIKKRPALKKFDKKKIGDSFRLLVSDAHHYPALMAVGETYLAMPNPDDNFMSDLQTENFDARLWELYLFACFREQNLTVSQDQPSPDFLIIKDDLSCYVEAVTANSIEKNKGFPTPKSAPADTNERLLGVSANRFAKTLHSKIQRNYEKLPHVQGKPFALALADFHAPGSMVWTRESLPSYLYGFSLKVTNETNKKTANVFPVDVLLGEFKIPAGLFRSPEMAHLSAVIFSNAGTLGKFNRMGYLAGYQPKGLRMSRCGILFDRTPAALEPIKFDFDILDTRYTELWPGGEAWCQELELFHNPLAAHPIDIDLFPGATHWFESDQGLECLSPWEWTVLSSITHLHNNCP